MFFTVKLFLSIFFLYFIFLYSLFLYPCYNFLLKVVILAIFPVKENIYSKKLVMKVEESLDYFVKLIMNANCNKTA
jgi:hypothetical protein